jgi:rRNA-processing protein FCF1
MEKYAAIEQHIRQARIERSVYLAELIAEGILITWKGAKSAAEVLFSVARARNTKGVFTFDA